MSCYFYYICCFFYISNCSIYIEYLYNYILLLPLYHHAIHLGTYCHRLQWILMRIVENPIAFTSNELIRKSCFWVGE